MASSCVIKPLSVILTDIMPKRKICTAEERKMESIRRIVHTYNFAHVPVTQYFKRITSNTTNYDEIFTICDAFQKSVNIIFSIENRKRINGFVFNFCLQLATDHKFTGMLAETMCNVLSYDLCRLETIKFNAKLTVEEAAKEIIAHEIKLSHRYELLARILRKSVMLSRECLLTVFSLNPSWYNYTKLLDFQTRFEESPGYQSMDGLNSILSVHTNEQNGCDPLADPVQSILHGDKLATQLDQLGLWNDLTTVIINPRIKTLRWSRHNWPELSHECLRYIDEPELKVASIKQNAMAMNKGLRYVRQNSVELAKRLLQRAISRLSYRKSKHNQRKFYSVSLPNGGLLGFVPDG